MKPIPSGSYVQPRSIGPNVFCPCGSLMYAIDYRTVEERPERWIYWCCHKDGGHVSRALPLPGSGRA